MTFVQVQEHSLVDDYVVKGKPNCRQNRALPTEKCVDILDLFSRARANFNDFFGSTAKEDETPEDLLVVLGPSIRLSPEQIEKDRLFEIFELRARNDAILRRSDGRYHLEALRIKKDKIWISARDINPKLIR